MNIYEAIINFFRINKDSKVTEESDNLVDRMQIGQEVIFIYEVNYALGSQTLRCR